MKSGDDTQPMLQNWGRTHLARSALSKRLWSPNHSFLFYPDHRFHHNYYLELLSLSVFWIGTINWPLNSPFGLVDLFRSHRLHKQICAEPELFT